jgi:acetyl esterase/lipase
MKLFETGLRRVSAAVLLLTALCPGPAAWAQNDESRSPRLVARDVPYATNSGVVLKLDLYFPERRPGKHPVAVYLHGGGWQRGSKTFGGWRQSVTDELLQRGFAVACVDYRLAPYHKWPAYINDVKCSIRFLRASAETYLLDARHIGVWGTSAGGHLAALLGTTDADAGLEGEHYLDQSSAVSAVVDICGPSDIPLLTTAFLHRQRGERLFGPTEEILRKASPVSYASVNDPPFLIFHGANDMLVSSEQSVVLDERLRTAGVHSSLVIVKNAGHGLLGLNIKPSRSEIVKRIGDFFEEHVAGRRSQMVSR